MTFAAIIVAAGSGARAGQGEPKQWRILGGRPVIRWSAETFRRAGADPLVIVIPAGDEVRARAALSGLDGWILTQGGDTRALSVIAGLDSLTTKPADDIVLIHDAARPFVTSRHIESLLAVIGSAQGVVPALPVADTLKRAEGGAGALATLPRDGLWRAQTPQAFRIGALRDAYAAWRDEPAATDDAAVVERAGGVVALVPGDSMLMKLTYQEDFVMAERLAATATLTAVGLGFDVHRFGPGQAIRLCGVTIAHDHGLVGHSDADVGLHALTDALLGAVGEGDIGDHFPPGDPQWKGADSTRFLAHAAALVAGRRGRVRNVDLVIIGEAPRVKPHRTEMRMRLAELLALPVASVSVKATTTEGMGFLGRREGLAAQAVVTVELPIEPG